MRGNNLTHSPTPHVPQQCRHRALHGIADTRLRCFWNASGHGYNSVLANTELCQHLHQVGSHLIGGDDYFGKQTIRQAQALPLVVLIDEVCSDTFIPGNHM